jgi:hypothetical protein
LRLLQGHQKTQLTHSWLLIVLQAWQSLMGSFRRWSGIMRMRCLLIARVSAVNKENPSHGPAQSHPRGQSCIAASEDDYFEMIFSHMLSGLFACLVRGKLANDKIDQWNPGKHNERNQCTCHQ